jgi:glycyl-tRNA synthetase beta chain
VSEALADARRDTLLLEIGVEELPAALCPEAMAQLRQRGEGLLRAQRLDFGRTQALGTPRRLAWLVEGLAPRQRDAEVSARGPARTAAFDAAGQPTAAAVGFARAQGVPVTALTVGRVGEREYVFAHRREAGRPASLVLAQLLPELVASLQFARSMRWGTGDFRFPRPVRWVVALLGAAVIPCTVADLPAGRISQGHRSLHPDPLVVPAAADYVEVLRAAGVMVDRQERREAVRAGIAAAAAAVGGRVRPEPELLDEVTDLNEWPTAFAGAFDPAALRLPPEVLVTVMRVHQRYFPVEDAQGRLLPRFVGVRNGGREHLDTVVRGNERVLAARFADARFFYDEDARQTLAACAARLDGVAFAAGLGTMADKAQRLAALASRLGETLGADVDTVSRAALLCKADRLTHLGAELPELEGIIGAHYAARDGEPPPVVAAIGEHVLPRAAADGALPATAAGRALALADRLDTLAGNFLLGRQPRGGADPLGLRRAAGACIRLAEAAGPAFALRPAVAWAVQGYAGLLPEATAAAPRAVAELTEFLRGRLEARLAELGHRPDVIDAVLAAGDDPVADVLARCAALSGSLGGSGWADTVTAFKRAGHLARQGDAGDGVDPSLFRHPTEEALWRALTAARAAAAAAASRRDHAGVLEATAGLRQPVDAFLTEVLAMDPDPAIRRNRLALLAGVAAVPACVADLGRLSG